MRFVSGTRVPKHQNPSDRLLEEYRKDRCIEVFDLQEAFFTSTEFDLDEYEMGTEVEEGIRLAGVDSSERFLVTEPGLAIEPRPLSTTEES